MVKIRKKIKLNIKYGNCQFITFSNLHDNEEHFALVFKNATQSDSPLVRLHSECITGDLFGSYKCDCGDQLDEALKIFSKSGGILIYLRQEGRGIGLYNKIDAYSIQETGLDTYQANTQLNLPEDMRNFEVAAEMLKALGVYQIDLLSNNPQKYNELLQNGVAINKKVSTSLFLKSDNEKYLLAKMQKAGHQYSQRLLNTNGASVIS